MFVMVPLAEGTRLETRQPSKADFDTTNSLIGKVKNYLTETNFISGNVFSLSWPRTWQINSVYCYKTM